MANKKPLSISSPYDPQLESAPSSNHLQKYFQRRPSRLLRYSPRIIRVLAAASAKARDAQQLTVKMTCPTPLWSRIKHRFGIRQRVLAHVVENVVFQLRLFQNMFVRGECPVGTEGTEQLNALWDAVRKFLSQSLSLWLLTAVRAAY